MKDKKLLKKCRQIKICTIGLLPIWVSKYVRFISIEHLGPTMRIKASRSMDIVAFYRTCYVGIASYLHIILIENIGCKHFL